MKTILVLIFILLCLEALAQDKPSSYAEYLQSVQRELDRNGTQLNINNQNPFITGSALQNYFLNEKILLLERDAYFMMKSNKLETTEEVADYQHRLKVLTSHSNNILLSMMRALKNSDNEGFTGVEAPKHQAQWEDLIATCRKDPACVSRKLDSGEVVLQNDLIDSFALSLQVFKQIPYMHAIEFASLFQLVQLLQLEAIVGHNRVSAVEFDLFIKKQKKLAKEVDENTIMTKKEKEYHRTMVSNTVSKWKKKILERKFDQVKRFEALAEKLKKENQSIISELEKIRQDNPEILSEKELCRRFIVFKKDRRKCILREKLEDSISDIKAGKAHYLGSKEKKLPEDFWQTI